jgi:hypothetical protein
LQTILEMSSERATIMVLPLPIDVLSPFLGKGTGNTD